MTKVSCPVLACIHNQTISCDPHTGRHNLKLYFSHLNLTQNRLVLQHTSFQRKLSRERWPLSLQFIMFSCYRIIWYCSSSMISKSIVFNCHCHNQLPNFFAHFLAELDACSLFKIVYDRTEKLLKFSAGQFCLYTESRQGKLTEEPWKNCILNMHITAPKMTHEKPNFSLLQI